MLGVIWQFIVTYVLENPILLAAFFTALEADPALTPQEKAAITTFMMIAPYYAAKTPGWIVFQPDAAGTPPVQIFHVQP